MLAAIFDSEGPRLSLDERAFFRDVDPLGFIVFARHCESADALRAHCDELREAVGREDAPILIDQEGGRVARMRPPAMAAHPPPAVFGELYRLDPARARRAARLNAELIARALSACGVTVNCVPMLDVPQPDADPAVIGDRAIAKHPDVIAELGREVLEGTLNGGCLPVIKHLPGHGRALCDSHDALPTVEASRDDLADVDFRPFAALRDAPFAMTAHILYPALDPDAPATLSATIIAETIRGTLGFENFLFGDDLKMKALGGDLAARARQCLAAGCDAALCCNFDMGEKRETLAGLAALSAEARARMDAAAGLARAVGEIDARAARAELDEMVKPVWSARA